MAEVYWIHLPEHTDIFTQGYVGVTSRTAFERFKEHIYVSRSSRSEDVSRTISKAINKYGDTNLIVETVLIGDDNYCYIIESKLRPCKAIGWNQSEGGMKPPSRAGSEVSIETRKRISDSNQKGKFYSKEARERISKLHKGRTHSEEHKNKLFKNVLLKNSENWSKAQSLYFYYIEGFSDWYCENLYSVKHGSFKGIFERFKNNWIPTEDKTWCEVFLGKDYKNGT